MTWAAHHTNALWRPEPFDLLEAVGRDCVGTLQLLPPGVEPVGFNQVQAQPLSEREVAEHLRRTVTSAPLGAPHTS